MLAYICFVQAFTALIRTLDPIDDAYAFRDKILIIPPGTKSEHMQALFQVVTALDQNIAKVKLEKCKFAKSELEWLRLEITQQ